MSDDYIMQCPMCLKETKYIIQHLSKNKNCQIPGDLDSFKSQFRIYKQKYLQNRKREINEACMRKLREQENVKVKEAQRNRKEASRRNLREQDNEKVKEEQRNRKEAYMKNLREQDNEKVKEAQKIEKKPA